MAGANERELNLLIKAKDEASKVVQRHGRDIERVADAAQQMGDRASRAIDQIPAHLRPVSQELEKARQEFQQLSRASSSIDEISQSLNRVDASKITSVSNSGKEAIRVMQDLDGATRAAKLAVMGLSENGNVRISAEQASAQVEKYKQELELAKQKLIELKNAGDLGSYTAGMQALAQKTQEVERAMTAASRGGMEYIRVLNSMGIHTSDMANMSAVRMELYRDKFLQSIDMIMARSTQSEKIAQNLERIGNPIRALDQQLLKIGHRLEEMAKLGTPAAVALRELGPNASMKDLQDQIRLINQGIMRMQMLSMASAIAVGVLTAALTKLAFAVDETLTPAWEQFKATWIDALTPLGKTFSETVLKPLIALGTAIGEFVQWLNTIDPAISSAIGMFTWLFTVITLLLSPLAIGISRAGSMAVAFRVLWQTIGPLVTGFLTVAGTAAIVAAAIVAVGVVLYEAWQHSETFRQAVGAAWAQFQAAVLAALIAIQPAWEAFKVALMQLVATVAGGTGTMGDLWRALGDAFAWVINNVIAVAMPIFINIVEGAALIISLALKGLAAVLTWLALQWQAHEGTLRPIVTNIVNAIQAAFQAVGDFITTLWPYIRDLILACWNMIRTVAVAVWPYLETLIKAVMGAILILMQYVWPIVQALIIDTWESIKRGIIGALNVITGIFEAFTALFRGDWEGLWLAVQKIFSGAWDVLVSLFELFLFGKIFKLAKRIGEVLLKQFDEMWQWIKMTWETNVNRIMEFLGGWPGKMVQIGKDLMAGLINGINSMVNRMIDSVANAVNGAIDAAKQLLGIHSPSRVFMEIGGYTTEGFAVGIERAAALATKAMDSVTGQVASVAANPLQIMPASVEMGANRSGGSGPTIIELHFAEGSISLPGVKDGEGFAKSMGNMSLRQALKIQ